MNKPGLWLLLVAMVILGVTLPRWANQPDQPPPPRQKLVLATSASLFSGLVFIAHDRGFLADEGLEVTLNILPAGLVALQAMLQNQADISAVADYPIMNAVLQGEKIRILGTIASSNKHNAVIARKDHGIAVFGDLQGKKVGVTFGTTSEFLLEILLSLHHLPIDAIEKIQVRPQDMADAIMSDHVDAICSFNPYRLIAQKQLGENHAVFYGSDIYTERFHLVARDDYVVRNPQVVAKVLRAMLRAIEFLKKTPDMARDSVTRYVNIEKTLLAEIWEIYDYELTMDQAIITTMESQAQWAIHRGLSADKTIPNFLDLLYLDGMQTVSPDAITVIR